MSPERRKYEDPADLPDEKLSEDMPEDFPGPEHADWDEIESGIINRDDITIDELENGSDEGGIPEEDDDNPYQESDEALPDDEEERAIRRHPSREGGPFDEI